MKLTNTLNRRICYGPVTFQKYIEPGEVVEYNPDCPYCQDLIATKGIKELVQEQITVEVEATKAVTVEEYIETEAPKYDEAMTKLAESDIQTVADVTADFAGVETPTAAAAKKTTTRKKATTTRKKTTTSRAKKSVSKASE